MQFKIFPYGILPDGRKSPLIRGWEEAASSDPEQIAQWQAFFRERIVGWGLACKPSGIFAVDIDVKDDRNGFEWFQQQGITLPNTAYQRTPSGGAHLFFKYDESIASKTSVNAETGVDTRGAGGFVWLYQPDFSIPLLEIPTWIHQVLAKPVNNSTVPTSAPMQLLPEYAMDRFNSAIQAIRNAGVGERNNVLNTQSYIVGQLVESGAVDAQYAETCVREAAESIGLEAGEIQSTVRSGFKGGAAHPLTHPFGNTPPVPAINMDIALPAPPMQEEPTRWTPRFGTRADLMNWQYLKKPQLFEDWSSIDPILTSAIGGVGKTTLKLYEAVCLAVGLPFLGFRCLKPGRTLFVVGEDSEEKLYAMLGRICQQMGFLNEDQEHMLQAVLSNVVVKCADDLTLVTYNKATNTYAPNGVGVDKLRQAIDDLKPVQIILDPIAMFWGPEAGGNDMAMALSKAIIGLVKYSGASVDMISHIGKDSHSKKDTSQFSARGATALPNHSRIVRTLITVSDSEFKEETGVTLEDDETAIKCYVTKFSDGSPLLCKPFIIVRKGYLFSRRDVLEGIEDAGLNSNDRERVYQFIKTHSREDRPVTVEIVKDYFYTQTPRIQKSTAGSLVGNLEFEKLIDIVPHPDATVGNWLRAKD